LIKALWIAIRDSRRMGAVALGAGLATCTMHFAPGPVLLFIGLPLYLFALCAALLALANRAWAQTGLGIAAVAVLAAFTVFSPEKGALIVLASVISGFILYVPLLYATIAVVAFFALRRREAA
jgi:hypothetical protein